MEKFGWAYIGCGGIAHITAQELVKTEGQYIVSAWNRTHEKAVDFVFKFGGTAYDTAEEAINSPGVDGVYIAVTADQHLKYMELCIRNHKPVLCEKPFTVNAEQARGILELAAREGVYVSEAMWTWHNATAKQVRAWVKEGLAGKIRRVQCFYSFPMVKLPIQKPRHTSPDMIGGALLDIGVYCIRYCYELFGMPREILCSGRVKDGIDLGETVTLRYDGFDAELTVSRDQNHGEKLVIEGEKGIISVPMFHMAKAASLKGTVTAKTRDSSLLYGTQFARVAEEIRSGVRQGIAVTPQSTIDCMHIMDICRDQMGLVYPCERTN